MAPTGTFFENTSPKLLKRNFKEIELFWPNFFFLFLEILHKVVLNKQHEILGTATLHWIMRPV